jgi:hypothetical protein
MRALVSNTGASVIVPHHFTNSETSTPEQASGAIRRTGGPIYGARSVYSPWNPKDNQAKAQCASFKHGSLVMVGEVKANGRANLRVTTFLHCTRGLLAKWLDK